LGLYGVYPSGLPAGPDQRVRLVDEQDSGGLAALR
jgi:hypothetical protein